MADWVAATAEHTQTPPDLAALAGLGVLSAAALGRAVVDCGGWEEELGLYLMPVLPSGERKSAVLRAATAPLRAIERERQEAAKPMLARIIARRAALDSRARKLAQQASHSDADERVMAERELAVVTEELDQIGVPVAPRMLIDDVTPEKLGSLLAQHGSLAAIAAESALIDALVGGRYSEGKANLHLVLAAYNGEATTIDRQSRDTEYLERPLLTITLIVQPHVLAALLAHKTARTQGLVGRFAYALPESLIGDRRVDAARTPREVSTAWAEVVRRVAETADNADKGTSQPPNVGIVSTFEPKRITLAPRAEEELRELRRQIEPRLGTAGDLASIADWAERHHGRVERIGGLLLLCEPGAREAISEDTMRRAIRIGDYLLAHGIAAFTAPDSLTRRALRWLEDRGQRTVTQRQLHRGPLGGRGPSEDAELLIADLQRLNAVRELPTEHPTSRMFEVHPDLIRTVKEPRIPPTRGDAAPQPADATDPRPPAEQPLPPPGRRSPGPAPPAAEVPAERMTDREEPTAGADPTDPAPLTDGAPRDVTDRHEPRSHVSDPADPGPGQEVSIATPEDEAFADRMRRENPEMWDAA